MRAVALGATALLATVALSGCTQEPPVEEPDTIPDKVATGTMPEDPKPVLDALGEGWEEGGADPAEVLLCEEPFLPRTSASSATVTDPEGRTVVVDFVEVDSARETAEGVAAALEECPAVEVGSTLFLSWTYPSSTIEDGALGYVLPMSLDGATQLDGGVGLTVAPATSDVAVVVRVYANQDDDGTAEIVERYAEAIADNQLQANLGTSPDPVPALSEIVRPEDEGTAEPVVPPVGTTTYDPEEDPTDGYE